MKLEQHLPQNVPEESPQAKVADQLMGDRIPYISRRGEIVGDEVNSAAPERALRIPWGREGQFITILYDPQARRPRQSLKQWLGQLFHRRAV